MVGITFGVSYYIWCCYRRVSYVRYLETGSIYALVRVKCIHLKTFKETCVICEIYRDRFNICPCEG